jgi:DNA invertase Pin-like site-specific DNA recombinase
MIYGYARVSTSGQDLYGTSLEDQVDVLKSNGAEEIYADAYTGSSMKRPNFDKLLGVIKDGDTLIVTKMDRLGRTSEGIITLIKDFLKRDITVKVLNMGTLENTPVGRMIVTFLAGFAEFERDLIIERTKAGREYRKLHDPNYRDGRKPIQYDSELFEQLKQRTVNGEITAAQAAKLLGVGRSKWFEIVKERSAAS